MKSNRQDNPSESTNGLNKKELKAEKNNKDTIIHQVTLTTGENNDDPNKHEYADIIFIEGWNNISSEKPISKVQYDSLQLHKVKLPYDNVVEMLSYRSVINKQNQQLVILKLDIETEIYQYLLTYKANKLVDYINVSYEDFVEYFSRTSSSVKNNIVETVTTSWIDNGESNEKADTIVSIYELTPELTFKKQLK